MSERELLDTFHFDPCYRCKKFFYRGDLIPMSKVKVMGLPPNKKKRGRVCRECAWRMEGMHQGRLFAEYPGGET